MYVFEVASDLLKLPRPESLFLLEPYVPQNSIVVLYGKPTLGKTAIAWNIAHAIQSGEPLWGFPTQKANVLFLELDMPMLMVQERWADADPPFEPTFCTVFEDVTIDCTQFLAVRTDERHREIIRIFADLHARYNFGLVCVDALREVVIGDINISGIPRRIYDAFRTIFPGAAILFVHHERKTVAGLFGPPDPLQAASGSMEFMNIAQVAIQFQKRGKDTWLEHLKTQASAQFESLPLSLRDDGIHIYNRNEEKLAIALQIIERAPPGIAMRELDKQIGVAIGMSDRSARVIRLAIQQERKL